MYINYPILLFYESNMAKVGALLEIEECFLQTIEKLYKPILINLV